jgi:hypothetical protein
VNHRSHIRPHLPLIRGVSKRHQFDVIYKLIRTRVLEDYENVVVEGIGGSTEAERNLDVENFHPVVIRKVLLDVLIAVPTRKIYRVVLCNSGVLVAW